MFFFFFDNGVSIHANNVWYNRVWCLMMQLFVSLAHYGSTAGDHPLAGWLSPVLMYYEITYNIIIT